MKKKAKRLLASLTAAAAMGAVCCAPLSVNGIRLDRTALTADAASTLTSGDFQYTLDNELVTITKYTGDGAEVLIPAEINGSKVAVIEKNAFRDNLTITSVTIPASVTAINNLAFYGCKNERMSEWYSARIRFTDSIHPRRVPYLMNFCKSGKRGRDSE